MKIDGYKRGGGMNIRRTEKEGKRE